MDRIKVERAIAGLTEWQKHVQTNSDIDRDISTAIEALKAQLYKEGTTSDTISRQDALDIFDDYNVSVENGELEAYSRDRKRLCELPSVQPEPTDEQVLDYCKKRDLHLVTYDLFQSIRLNHKVSFGDKDHVWIDGKQYISLRRFQEAVKEAQPKEGYWIEGKIYRDVIECNCSECGQLMTTAASVRMNYCPKCGAKMKGERQK